MWRIVYILNDSSYSILLIISLILLKSWFINILFIYFLYLYIQINSYVSIYEYLYFFKKNNITLINGLLLIHPILLYISYMLLISFFKKKINFNNSYAYNYINLRTIINLLTNTSLIALILGSWWAQQEINWGGWWNWDPIEMIALFIFIFSLILIHFKFDNSIVFLSMRIQIIYLFILIYYISRYDILNSIHSFAISNKDYSFIELKMIVFLLFLLYYLINIFIPINISLRFFFYSLITILVLFISLNVLNSSIFDTISNYNYRLYVYIIFFSYICYNIRYLNKIKIQLFLILVFFLSDVNIIIIYLFMLLLIFYIKNTKHVFLHLLFVLTIVLIYNNNLLDIFIKISTEKIHTTYMLPNLNWVYLIKKNQFNTISDAFNYSLENMYINQSSYINNLYSNYISFYFQKIFTNFFLNWNVTNTHNKINFTQLYLFISMLLLFLLGIYTYLHNKYKLYKVV